MAAVHVITNRLLLNVNRTSPSAESKDASTEISPLVSPSSRGAELTLLRSVEVSVSSLDLSSPLESSMMGKRRIRARVLERKENRRRESIGDELPIYFGGGGEKEGYPEGPKKQEKPLLCEPSDSENRSISPVRVLNLLFS